jgi:hypothetical protein
MVTLHLLPELAPSAGLVGQLRLPRLLRAGPSTSLDERLNAFASNAMFIRITLVSLP